MSNFDLTPLEEDPENKTLKHTLETFCWLYREGDALLAAGGADGLIRILSVANSEEINILEGHQSKCNNTLGVKQSN